MRFQHVIINEAYLFIDKGAICDSKKIIKGNTGGTTSVENVLYSTMHYLHLT
jgi:hypothetical protein